MSRCVRLLPFVRGYCLSVLLLVFDNNNRRSLVVGFPIPPPFFFLVCAHLFNCLPVCYSLRLTCRQFSLFLIHNPSLVYLFSFFTFKLSVSTNILLYLLCLTFYLSPIHNFSSVVIFTCLIRALSPVSIPTCSLFHTHSRSLIFTSFISLTFHCLHFYSSPIYYSLFITVNKHCFFITTCLHFYLPPNNFVFFSSSTSLYNPLLLSVLSFLSLFLLPGYLSVYLPLPILSLLSLSTFH